MCDFDEKNEKINIDWIDWCVCAIKVEERRRKTLKSVITMNDEEKYEFIIRLLNRQKNQKIYDS